MKIASHAKRQTSQQYAARKEPNLPALKKATRGRLKHPHTQGIPPLECLQSMMTHEPGVSPSAFILSNGCLRHGIQPGSMHVKRLTSGFPVGAIIPQMPRSSSESYEFCCSRLNNSNSYGVPPCPVAMNLINAKTCLAEISS